MRNAAFLVVFVLIFTTLQAQPYPQLRFKTGLNITYPSSRGSGYAYKNNFGADGSIVLGGEFSHPFKSKKGAWHVGFVFHDNDCTPMPNSKNLYPTSLAAPSMGIGLRFMSAPAKTIIYGGIEKYINRNTEKLSKNYFSVFAGVGVSFTLNKIRDWKDVGNEKYATRDGGTVDGYISDLYPPKFPIAPTAYAGVRYNITNKKGIEVFIIELVANYGFTPFYRQTVDYYHNGVPRQDKLKDNAFSVQLNLIVPLFSFKKKHLKKLPDLDK
jgi:hypothetical protein